MFERRDAVAIRYLPGSGIDQDADDLLVDRSAVAEDHRLHQRSPAEIVDVVDVDSGLDENAHRRRMAVSAAGISAVPP